VRTKQVKGKGMLTLCLARHHNMKTYWRNADIAPQILSSGTRWRRVDDFIALANIPPRKQLDRPRTYLDAVAKRKQSQ
jgi:hypothetical protein